jgi:hypothetical protein
MSETDEIKGDFLNIQQKESPVNFIVISGVEAERT